MRTPICVRSSSTILVIVVRQTSADTIIRNIGNTVAIAFFAAAAMKTGYAKKLTNILTGDIINIEIKKYGEEIDEEL